MSLKWLTGFLSPARRVRIYREFSVRSTGIILAGGVLVTSSHIGTVSRALIIKREVRTMTWAFTSHFRATRSPVSVHSGAETIPLLSNSLRIGTVTQVGLTLRLTFMKVN